MDPPASMRRNPKPNDKKGNSICDLHHWSDENLESGFQQTRQQLCWKQTGRTWNLQTPANAYILMSNVQ
jgi:hypothetical protein